VIGSMSRVRKLLYVVGALGIAAALAYAFIPPPEEVDVAQVERGTLQVTINEDGKTRIKERYEVTSPLAGRLLRIELHAGDVVQAGETVLAMIEPVAPSLLDARAEAEAEARVRAATAGREHAAANLNGVQATLAYALAEHTRTEKLLPSHAVTQAAYEAAVHELRLAREEVRAAEFAVQIAEFELDQAEAALQYTRDAESASSTRFEIRSPIDGEVLRVDHESAGVVSAGSPLMQVGDPRDLELEIDVLSSDAVRIPDGAKVILEHWGANKPLAARVRLVERQAFLKVSSLGVEEQRVNVIADFVDPPEARQRLGDAYQVEARIVTWEGSDVLHISAGALFRDEDQWAVYRVVDGRAQVQHVQIGQSNGLETEIISGLTAGDAVIAYPTDQIRHGTRVVER